MEVLDVHEVAVAVKVNYFKHILLLDSVEQQAKTRTIKLNA